MVTIDQLRISDDGKNLYLDIHVSEASYFDNVYLDKVTILTEEQVSELNPESFGDDYIYQGDVESITSGLDVRELHLVLCANDFNEKYCKGSLSDHIFFVYITCKGTPAFDTPCGMDEMTTLAVTLDYRLVFNNAMCYTRELADSCSVPSGFIDFILNYEALKMSISTGHYLQAIERFKWIKGSGCAGNGVVAGKGCGCGK